MIILLRSVTQNTRMVFEECKAIKGKVRDDQSRKV